MAYNRTIGLRKVLRLAEKRTDKTVKSEVSKRKNNRKKMRKYFATSTLHAIIKQVVKLYE